MLKNGTILARLLVNRGIYQIINLIDNKIYIGSAVNISLRWAEHRSTLLNNNHINIYLQRAVNKYGLKNFKFEVIEFISKKEDLIKQEQYYLDLYKPFADLKRGYNILKIADSPKGRKLSLETRLKMSKAQIGRKHSLETRLRMSLAQKGEKHHHYKKKYPKEVRQKMSESKKGQIPWIKGKGHTKEIRKKISESLKRTWAIKKGKIK